MKQYSPQNIRNVVLLSHSGVGKTTLLEHLLYNHKVISRLGSTADGTSQVDYLPFEMEKRFTISSKLFPIEIKDVKVNFLDTPGYPDFIGDVVGSLRVSENAVLLVDAAAGVQIHTLKMWKFLKRYQSSKVIFITKLDTENSSFENSLDSIQKQLTEKIVILQIPVGEGDKFTGVIDLVTKKYYKAKDDGNPPDIIDIPSDMNDYVEEYRTKMIEAIVETDNVLLEKYFEGEIPTEEKIMELLKNGIINDLLVPVLCGSATRNCGLNNLLEKIVAMFPSPVSRKEVEMMNPDNPEEIVMYPVSESKDFAGLVFKTVVEEHIGELTFIKNYSGKLKVGDEVINSRTSSKERIGQIAVIINKKRDEMEELVTGDIATLVKLKDTKVGDTLKKPSVNAQFKPIRFPAPVLKYAVFAENKKDQEKLSSALHSFAHGDPTFKILPDPIFNQLLIAGMGELQLDLMLKKVKNKVNVDYETRAPRIAYRETITKQAEAQGKYKKQSGGRGQYGDCHIRVIPGERGNGFEFRDKIFGGSIPAKYVPAVEKGVKDALERGYIAGYPIVDTVVEVYDGTYHNVDSSDLAFQIAGSFAVKAVCEKAKVVLLEPVLNLEVSVPEQYLGDVMGDINSRRGRVQGMDTVEGVSTVKAQVPEREMAKYATDLRSLTRGQGDFTTSYSHYELVPPDVAKKVVEESAKYREEEE